VLVATVLATPAAVTASQIYAVTDLGTLGGDTGAIAISNAGWVVGTSVTFPPYEQVQQAFLYRDGAMKGLGTLGGPFGELFSWSSRALAINDAGDVVGSSAAPAGPYAPYRPEWHAFLYHHGRMIDLGTLAADSIATGINDAGDVVGSYFMPGRTTPRAFLYRGGAMIDIGTLGGSSSEAYAINSAGVVVGTSSTSGDLAWHLFRYDGGVMTDLGTLGGSFAEPHAINRRGQIVGQSTPDDRLTHAFLYDDGVMHDLGVLGGPVASSGALGINAAGQVVGWSIYGSVFQGLFVEHAFLYIDGVMVDLNTLVPAGTPTLWGATAINDAGQILAWGMIYPVGSDSGVERAYLLTPPCGNGRLDVGEACDDGVRNGTASCCTTDCVVAPPGTPCDAGLCGQAGTCQRILACGATPATGCQPAASGKSKLDLQRNEIGWTWTSSARVAIADFGDPTVDADYQLCVYAGGSLATQARIPADGICARGPCWKRVGRTGYERRQAAGDPDGIVALTLRAGRRGAGRLRLVGAGANLATPALPLALPVRFQLQNDAGTACWESSFSRAVTNAPGRFTAKAD